MADWRDFLSADFWRTHTLEASYAAFGFLSFVFFLFATFPYRLALAAMVASMGLNLTSSAESLNLPIGAQLENVRIASAAQPNGPPLLESSSVVIAPSIGSLLLLRPGVRASAELYGGTVVIRGHQSAGASALTIDAKGVNLASSRALRAIGAAFGGQVSGSGDFVITPGPIASDSGSLTLEVSALSIRIAPGLPPLKLGDVLAKLRLEHGSIAIDEVKNVGGDVALKAAGTITLAPDWLASTLAIRLTLNPAAGGRANLGILQNLLPHPPSSEPYMIRGTFRAPAIS